MQPIRRCNQNQRQQAEGLGGTIVISFQGDEYDHPRQESIAGGNGHGIQIGSGKLLHRGDIDSGDRRADDRREIQGRTILSRVREERDHQGCVAIRPFNSLKSRR